MTHLPSGAVPERQPIFNLPGVVLFLLGALILIHAIRTWVLSSDADIEILLLFAFIPVRIIDLTAFGVPFPGGSAAQVWSFASYAFLHADWSHLIFNGLWLAAFGSPVAVRFGPARFLVYSLAGAIGGAALHLAIYPSSAIPMIGASAAVSAHMAGAARFVFSGSGSLVGMRRGDPSAYHRPAPPLTAILQNRSALTFLAVWFIMNLLFGLFGGSGTIASGAIAWEAHIGGFLAGLLLFPLLDPVRRPQP
ncbi:rhomboid family intramembrane serine protease [Bauldia litoralis]|uniref:Membrane associated serine protease, rhomboid family n=1 Tax=Bauldia litoralis TaxID=665467 RepID=A0A1G6DIF5_9HYPH|nr:rhomboid family intramembrane serine protease [Bauldia litoralis]SDB44879.1 Membrane associated serine protease, rhomboid family [Bauldia litoralis]